MLSAPPIGIGGLSLALLRCSSEVWNSQGSTLSRAALRCSERRDYAAPWRTGYVW